MKRESILEIASESEITLYAAETADEHLGLVLEAVGLGAFEKDLKTKEVMATKTHLKIMGNDPRSTTICPLNAVLPEDRERVLRLVDYSIRNHRDIEIPFRVSAPTGGVRWVFLKGRVTYDKCGNPLKLQGVSQDITKCIETNEYLKEQTERHSPTGAKLGNYSSALVKDLKTPFQSILANADLLNRTSSQIIDKTAKRLEAIMRSTQGMTKLIDDLIRCSLPRRK